MKVAIFAGTFDPPTLGHFEIIQRAAKLCDQLYIAVAPSGKHALSLSQESRIYFLKELVLGMKTIEVVPLTGLVVDLVQKYHADFLVRGLRGTLDLDYEMSMGSANRQMIGIETVCLIASQQYCHIHSALVRQIAENGRRLDGFVPPTIEEKVFEAIQQQLNHRQKDY